LLEAIPSRRGVSDDLARWRTLKSQDQSRDDTAFMVTDQIFDSLSGIRNSSGEEVQLIDAIHGLIASGSLVVGVMFAADERQVDFGNRKGS